MLSKMSKVVAIAFAATFTVAICHASSILMGPLPPSNGNVSILMGPLPPSEHNIGG
jgi:hypothetical protein